MVRQRIQHSLNWLSQQLAWLKADKENRHHSALPPNLSPPPQQRAVVHPQTRLPSSSVPIQQQSEDLSTERAALQKRPPNPAANRAANPSTFQVVLSNYQYAPSSAVQGLSHQLANPNQLRSAGIQEACCSTQTKDEQITPLNHERDLKHSGPCATTLRSREIPPLQTKISLSLPFINSPDNITSINRIAMPIPATINESTQVITKTGVVKLLFKFKKNNHHGYIAPDDGSKDIIFHKKYIGHEVFCQLERGMAVEVTAHITEGKAYADHVRII